MAQPATKGLKIANATAMPNLSRALRVTHAPREGCPSATYPFTSSQRISLIMAKRTAINSAFATALDTAVAATAVLNGSAPEAFKAAILADAKLSNHGLSAAEMTFAVYVGFDVEREFVALQAREALASVKAAITDKSVTDLESMIAALTAELASRNASAKVDAMVAADPALVSSSSAHVKAGK